MGHSTTEKKGKGKKVYIMKKCPHGKEERFCDLCEHKKRKYDCAQCNKGKVKKVYIRKKCEHGKGEQFCFPCGGSGLCKTPHCPTIKNPKYDGHCWYCFANLFPDKPMVRRYRTKENTVVTFLEEKFPNVDWRWNKTVEGGCSKRRPDLFLDMGSHVVIVEVDENSHDGYDPTCEEKRLGLIWEDVFLRKIVFIQFNTDGYKNEDGNNVPSPWGANKLGCTIRPKWKAAWEARLEKLRLTVEHRLIESSTKEEFELVHLYY